MIGYSGKFLMTAALGLTIVGTSEATAQYQGPYRPQVWVSRKHEQVDRLASRLEREARYLNRETDSRCNGAPDYRAFERQVDDIVRLADHIHDVAHRGQSLRHLRGDVERIDRLYHSTERLFERMVAFRRLDRETVFHLRRALNAVERTTHDLRDLID